MHARHRLVANFIGADNGPDIDCAIVKDKFCQALRLGAWLHELCETSSGDWFGAERRGASLCGWSVSTSNLVNRTRTSLCQHGCTCCSKVTNARLAACAMRFTVHARLVSFFAPWTSNKLHVATMSMKSSTRAMAVSMVCDLSPSQCACSPVHKSFFARM